MFGRGDTKRRWVGIDDVARLVATGPPLERQRMPRVVARVGMRVLARSNDALASVFGAGLATDLVAASWDDSPLRQRGITPTSATDFIQQQARALSTPTSVS